MLSKIAILGVKITLNSKTEILSYIKKYLLKASAKSLTIFTPNPEQVVAAQTNKIFKDILNSADIALPDGAGIVWAIKKLSAVSSQLSVNIERIAGVEFMDELVKLAAEENYPIGLIGGRDGVAQMTLDKLKQKYPKLNSWNQDVPEIHVVSGDNNAPSTLALASRGGDGGVINVESYFKQLADRIKKSGTKLVFVGLGAPKQELFIQAISCQLSADSSPTVFMSVGGAFDILSGKIPRSPEFFRSLNIEWLWRLIIEPWRINRQLRLIKFVWLVLKGRLGGKMN